MQKALNLFNAALVTPTYYVYFTSATIVTSAILFQGFKGSVTSIINVILGFLVICCGVILLQLSKSAKDVPDAAIFKGDLDQVREVAEQQESESEPKADAIRGAAAIIRRMSNSRQKLEVEEAKKIQEDKRRDMMEPIGEDEQIEWDGLRRRKTTMSVPAQARSVRRSMHPPLGMSHFPEEDGSTHRPTTGSEDERGGAIDAGFAPRPRAAQSAIIPSQQHNPGHGPPMHPIALTEISLPPQRPTETPVTAQFHPHRTSQRFPNVWGFPTGLSRQQGFDGAEEDQPAENSYLAPPNAPSSRGSTAPTPPPHTAKRQFSFQNVFHRHRGDEADRPKTPKTPRKSPSMRQASKETAPSSKNATEEERMGLVTGDSTHRFSLPAYQSEEDEDWQLESGHQTGSPERSLPRRKLSEKSIEEYEADYEHQRREWAAKHDVRDSGLPPERDLGGRGGGKNWEGHRPGGNGGAFI